MEDVKLNRWMAEFNVSSNYQRPSQYLYCHYFDASKFGKKKKKTSYEKILSILKNII